MATTKVTTTKIFACICSSYAAHSLFPVNTLLLIQIYKAYKN